MLLVTGQAQIDEEQSIQRGSAGLLRKPVRTATLIEKIEHFMATGKLKAAA